jgi:hypothetical protein
MLDDDERTPFNLKRPSGSVDWGRSEQPCEQIDDLPQGPLYPDDGFVSPDLRAAIYARDGYRCLRCKREENLQIDHVKPWSRGGYTTEANLQTLCGRCNRWKGTKEIDFRPTPEPGPFDLELCGTARSARLDEIAMKAPLSLQEQFREERELHLLRRWWIEGDLPGYPGDDASLSRAWKLMEQRIKDDRS